MDHVSFLNIQSVRCVIVFSSRVNLHDVSPFSSDLHVVDFLPLQLRATFQDGERMSTVLRDTRYSTWRNSRKLGVNYGNNMGIIWETGETWGNLRKPGEILLGSRKHYLKEKTGFAV